MRTIAYRLFRVAAVLGRILMVIVIVGIVAPPVSAAVGISTLLHAPLPGGEIPEERPQIVAEASTVLDANGEEIGLFRGFDQTVSIEPDEVPQVMKDAIVSIEDRRFYEHNGVDIEGIGRAAQANAEAGGVSQGGSTLTQQFVKNVYLSNERTVERKVREALLAVDIEKTMSKEEILFGYLESAYFGSGAYGIGGAAIVYFGVEVDELDISQAALLAGLVQAPTRLSPRNDVEAAQERRDMVLKAMKDEGYITNPEYKVEVARDIWLGEPADSPDPTNVVVVPMRPKGASEYPYFVDWVEQELVDLLGEQAVYNEGLTIETTIRPDLQEAAKESVAKRLENTEYPVDMSIVSLDPLTGHVVAMVGGRDYKQSQVNLAVGGSLGMQPGSSFKPIVLAKAMSLGMTPETKYEAPARWRVPGCTGDNCYLKNYSGGGGGSKTLRSATVASTNTVFTQLLVDVGIEETVELARQLGLERLNPEGTYGPSLALGAAETSPLEMASAFGTFSNRGVRVPPTGIRRVIDRDGNVIIDNSNRQGTKVLEPVVADNMTDVLQGVVTGGTGKAADIGRPVAGKTGTAQSYRAAWFVGYTPELSTAVWMGHADTPDSLRNVNGVGAVTGGSHPARAFADYMARAVEGTEVTEFPEPAEITPTEVEQSEKLVETLRRKETEVGEKRSVGSLASNCDGKSCVQDDSSRPDVPRSDSPPTTRPPPTTSTTVPPSSSSSSSNTTGPVAITD